jgi:hypothetical protein
MTEHAELWPRLAIAILATWRVTHLLAREDGPGDVIARLRAALGASLWGKLLDCFHCSSLWVAAPAALWVAATPLEACLVWLAISGAACLCERLGAPEVVMQRLPEIADTAETAGARSETQGDHDGMLRTEA